MSKVLIRFWAYDRCLTNPVKKYTWVQLLEKANEDLEEQGYKAINKTQFYEDIKTLKRPPHLAPIESYNENGKSYYRYSDPNYRFRDQALNELEAEQIRSALMVLGRFKGMPQFEWIQEIIPKLEKTFKLDNQADVIGFDQNVDLKGLNHFADLFNAIINKQVLSIKYQSFKSDSPTEIVLHPYYLKQYNNRWFLFGYNEVYDSLSNPALDRIISFKQIEDPFIENKQFDFDEYFEDIIGVTRFANAKSVKVKLKLDKEQGNYIYTKPLHGTQKLKWQEDGSAEVTFEVIPNFELEQNILRMGEKCRVLEPKQLVARIKDRITSAAKNYG